MSRRLDRFDAAASLPPSFRPSRRAVLWGASGLALAAVTGCTGGSDGGSSEEPEDAEPTQDEGRFTTVATSVVSSLAVFEEPDDPDASGGAGEQQRTLERSEETSGDIVLVALEVGEAWLHVQLPVRPNGTTGWVRVRDVRMSRHAYAMEIFLADHRLVVSESGQQVLETPVGVGRNDRPTPGGDYYIKELLQPPDPGGVYGPYAYGLSGYSNVLTEFAGGEGVIGVHGTNEPDLVGTDVSSGCIRMPNETITELVEGIGLPLGTPVTINA